MDVTGISVIRRLTATASLPVAISWAVTLLDVRRITAPSVMLVRRITATSVMLVRPTPDGAGLELVDGLEMLNILEMT